MENKDKATERLREELIHVRHWILNHISLEYCHGVLLSIDTALAKTKQKVSLIMCNHVHYSDYGYCIICHRYSPDHDKRVFLTRVREARNVLKKKNS